MSYILDALKKSEQERGQGSIPDVQTIHSASLNYDNKKNVYWPYILIAAVVLNFLAISYFIFNKENSITDKVPRTSQLASGEETEKQKEQNIEIQQANKISHTNKKISTDRKPNTRPTIKPTKKTLPINTSKQPISDYYDLPDSIKNRIPEIIVSAHVYSKNPLQRSIVINNNFMEEGEYVTKELMLHEITRDGAILDFEGTLINYSVISKWQ